MSLDGMSLDGLSLDALFVPETSRLKALLDHLSVIEDPREPWRVAHLLPEVLLLVVCGTLADCDDYGGDRRVGRDASAFCAASCPTTTGCRGRAGC